MKDYTKKINDINGDIIEHGDDVIVACPYSGELLRGEYSHYTGNNHVFNTVYSDGYKSTRLIKDEDIDEKVLLIKKANKGLWVI